MGAGEFRNLKHERDKQAGILLWTKETKRQTRNWQAK